MPQILTAPFRVPVPGGKLIDEHIGLASSGDVGVSIAHMRAPAGWTEPFQTPSFTEYTLVLSGRVVVECDGVTHEVEAGQTLVTLPGERIRYSVGPEGAEYVAVCMPAFTPDSVHREEV